MADLYLLNIAAQLDQPVEPHLGYFSPERREAILRYRFNSDRNRTLWAELLARRLIAERTGLAPGDVRIARDEDGRPYWEEGDVAFSLSHSGPWAACSIGGTASGVDVELDRKVSLTVAERFFLPGEARRLRALAEGGADEVEWRRAFLRYWTLKESCLKCLGLRDWRDVDCEALLDGRGAVAGRNFILPDGAVVGVCAPRDALPDQARVLRLKSDGLFCPYP